LDPPKEEHSMAFDPIATLSGYSAAECTVQMLQPGAKPVQFSGLAAAAEYAKEQGGKWNDVEITVHLPREDIVYASDKVRILIDAMKPRQIRNPGK
jgi:hypothetical protein